MASTKASWFHRNVLYRTPFYRRQECGNFHPIWDRFCFCHLDQHWTTAEGLYGTAPTWGSWHGGIRDLKTGEEYVRCPVCVDAAKSVETLKQIAKLDVGSAEQRPETARDYLTRKVQVEIDKEEMASILAACNMPYGEDQCCICGKTGCEHLVAGNRQTADPFADPTFKEPPSFVERPAFRLSEADSAIINQINNLGSNSFQAETALTKEALEKAFSDIEGHDIAVRFFVVGEGQAVPPGGYEVGKDGKPERIADLSEPLNQETLRLKEALKAYEVPKGIQAHRVGLVSPPYGADMEAWVAYARYPGEPRSLTVTVKKDNHPSDMTEDEEVPVGLC